MPHAKSCLECGKLIPPTETRCAEHQRRKNAAHNAPRAKYRSPAWRKRRAATVAAGCQVESYAARPGIGDCEGDVAAHHVYNCRAEAHGLPVWIFAPLFGCLCLCLCLCLAALPLTLVVSVLH